MDVDRDKHFSVSDLQVLEEEDNRVSGQALGKIHHFGTGSYYCSGCLVLAFPLTSYLPTGSVLPRSGGLFLSDLPTNQFKTNSAILNGYKKTLRASVSQLRYELIGW